LSSAATKLLLIGLDCADPALLTQWMETGDLPVLQSVRQRGTWGRLHSPPALADDATWASFQTGVSPARHGRYFFHAIEPGSYRDPFWQEGHLQYRPFWETLSDAGKRVAVIDAPKSPLSRNIHGIHVTDWRVHGRDRKTQSWPEGISAELLSRFGEDGTDCLSQKPWLCDAHALAEENYDEFISHLARSADDKLTYAQELLNQGGWDMFLVVFKEAHCISHKFWHLLDAANPAHSPEFTLRYGNAIKEIFKRLDRAIGRLLETAGPDTNVIIFSDLGMASNYTGNFSVSTRFLPSGLSSNASPRSDGLFVGPRTLALAMSSTPARQEPRNRLFAESVYSIRCPTASRCGAVRFQPGRPGTRRQGSRG